MAVKNGTERKTIPPATMKVFHLHVVIAGRRGRGREGEGRQRRVEGREGGREGEGEREVEGEREGGGEGGREGREAKKGGREEGQREDREGGIEGERRVSEEGKGERYKTAHEYLCAHTPSHPHPSVALCAHSSSCSFSTLAEIC